MVTLAQPRKDSMGIHRKFRLRRSAALAIALTSLLLVASACNRSDALPPTPATTVSVSRPIVRRVIEWDEYLGRLVASEAVDVRPRVSGLLNSAPFVEGSLVKQGDLLFVIDPRPYEAELERARAQVKQAEAQVRLAETEFRRVEKLLPTQAISEQEFEQRRQDLRAKEAQLEAARAVEKEAALKEEWTRVVAPIAGRIGRREVDPGNLVNGGSGDVTLLTNITAMDPVYCYVDADEHSVLKYQRLSREGKRQSARDTRIRALMALADETEFTREGYVDFVDNRVDPATGTLRARALFANPNYELTPGLSARLRVPGSEPYEAILVADAAVGTDQAKRFVLVVNDQGLVEYRPVQVGALFGKLRVVRSGLRPDEWVVVAGQLRARPGTSVQPERVAMPGGDVPTINAEFAEGGVTTSPTSRPTTLPAAATAATTATTATQRAVDIERSQ